MRRRLALLLLLIVILVALDGFAQAGGAKGTSTDSLVSSAFDRRQYKNAEDGVRVGRALEVPDPEYAEKARRRGIQGTIVLAIAINKNGEIDKVKVIQRLDPELDQAAVDAVKRWRFAPAEKDGVAAFSDSSGGVVPSSLIADVTSPLCSLTPEG